MLTPSLTLSYGQWLFELFSSLSYSHCTWVIFPYLAFGNEYWSCMKHFTNIEVYCIFLISHLLGQLSYQREENQTVLLSTCSSQIHAGCSLAPHYPLDAEKLVVPVIFRVLKLE